MPQKDVGKTASETNPVKVVKSQIYSTIPGYTKAVKSYFKDDSEVFECSTMCRDCLVSLQRSNFIPKWYY